MRCPAAGLGVRCQAHFLKSCPSSLSGSCLGIKASEKVGPEGFGRTQISAFEGPVIHRCRTIRWAFSKLCFPLLLFKFIDWGAQEN